MAAEKITPLTMGLIPVSGKPMYPVKKVVATVANRKIRFVRGLLGFRGGFGTTVRTVQSPSFRRKAINFISSSCVNSLRKACLVS
jgi:hypothetical protein